MTRQRIGKFKKRVHNPSKIQMVYKTSFTMRYQDGIMPRNTDIIITSCHFIIHIMISVHRPISHRYKCTEAQFSEHFEDTLYWTFIIITRLSNE